MKTRVSRTFFASRIMLGIVIASLVLASCNSTSPTLAPATPVATTAIEAPQAAIYQEAPMLAELVKADALPPVDRRLPQNPMLIQPEERVGKYGGVWRMAMVKLDTNLLNRTMGYESLVRWDKGWTKVIPNVAQSYEVSPDGRTFTFKLRQGMKWSDGQPFTADDIVFWYEAVFLNEELNSSSVDKPGGTLLYSWMLVGKDNLTVEKADDYTVVFRFAEPQGLFLYHMAGLGWVYPNNFPSHYLKQFHQAYNPNVDQLVTQAGAKDWAELFVARMQPNNPALPTLYAWTLEPESFQADGTPAPVIKAVRNPYYWKIDTEFNQLPYIDRLEIKVVETGEDILPLVLAGQVDMQDRNVPTAAALPANQAQGGYGLYTMTSSFSNYMVISFNQTNTDPVKREIFRNKDFRIGLSHAINRPAIIEAAGLDVKPIQVAPLPGTPFYNEQMATQYLEYDVALANEYLDNAGYSQRDADGFRLGPDGQRISFTMLAPQPIPIGNYDVHATRIQADWQAVGVEMKIETVSRAEAEARSNSNDFDVTFFIGAGGLDAILDPRHYVPTDINFSQQGLLWVKWYNNPQDPQAEEPPAPVKESITLYRQILQTTDPQQQNELMSQILMIAAAQFQVIGIHEVPVSYGVVKPNFHNVPPFMFSSSNYPQPAPTNPCQYFIDPQPE